jgi:hypothetical protein
MWLKSTKPAIFSAEWLVPDDLENFFAWQKGFDYRQCALIKQLCSADQIGGKQRIRLGMAPNDEPV